ncbi:hypothetical protein GCM10025868_42620 [Angustibacter aerolatus]|uniref:Uncharacterized protein n=1 Tax=Angustibacter aerolatus TaxID=1162965 RepID=A0ABQ6JQ93_9ACTN|nr:hypothetical protein GCM10025868_42620 [Angustibacter aerolatus]
MAGIASAADATAVLQALAVRRAAVLASASRSAVDAVAVPGSPVARRLTTDVRSLARRGLRYDGLALQAHGVRLLQGVVPEQRSRRRPTSRPTPWSIGTAGCCNAFPRPSAPCSGSSLVRGPAGWRLRSVEAA